MNNEKNKLIIKLKELSENEFNHYINLFNDPNNLDYTKIFFTFLYNDIIPEKRIEERITNQTNPINISSILLNPEEEIINYLDNTITNNIINDENIFLQLKEKLKIKKKEIKNKIKECNEHLQIIKKSYINRELEGYLPSNNSHNLIFNNKTILIMSDKNKNDGLQLAEFFTRYMLNDVIFKGKFDIDDFYDSNHFSCIRNDYSINEKFEYWFFLIFLIHQLFNKKSNYHLLFNYNEFIGYIKKLIKNTKNKTKDKPIIPNPNPKKGKKKTKKSFEGGNNDKLIHLNENIIAKTIQSTKQKSIFSKKKKDRSKDQKKYQIKDEIKISQVANLSKNITKEYMYVFDTKIKNDTLNKRIIQDFYVKRIKEYIEKIAIDKSVLPYIIHIKNINEFENIPYPLDINIKIKEMIPNSISFTKKYEKYNSSNITNSENKINSMINDIKYDIFDSLVLFINEKNENTKKYCKELNLKVILLLFFLYNTKKIIYEKYIEYISTFIKNNERNNELNNKLSNKLTNKLTNKLNNKSEIKKKPIILTEKNKKKLKINKQIEKINNSIKLMNNMKGTKEYEEKVLQLEDEKKKLIMEKYNIIRDIIPIKENIIENINMNKKQINKNKKNNSKKNNNSNNYNNNSNNYNNNNIKNSNNNNTNNNNNNNSNNNTNNNNSNNSNNNNNNNNRNNNE
jgi:hypothetical protein